MAFTIYPGSNSSQYIEHLRLRPPKSYVLYLTVHVMHLPASFDLDSPASLLANPKLTFCAEKKTWFGCGQHVPMVMDKIPSPQWCQCEPKVEKEGTNYPPMGKAPN